MQNNPLVSIITVVFNGVKHIEQTIQSVFRQTYPHIEYIIVDGGSTDGTVPVIKKYEHQLYKWISEKDRGISDAFNKGIALATGDIIGMINADDFYEPDAVQQVVDHFQEGEIFYGDLRLLRKERVDFVVKGDHELLPRLMTINHPTVFVKKEVYKKLGVFDESYACAMDYDLLLRFYVNNYRFVYVPAVLANMRWDGISDKYWIRGCRETLHIKNKYLPGRKLGNYLFFFRHLAGIAVPKYMEKLHLQFLVKAYRKRYALQKKIFEEKSSA
jgi:glycosyltransferase involved in cell wall biosynthesis